MDLLRSVLTVVVSVMLIAGLVALHGPRDQHDFSTADGLAATQLSAVTEPQPPDNCTNVFDWNFFNAKLTANNLGGQGPNVGDKKELRYSGVLAKGQPLIDLVVTTPASYKHAPKFGGETMNGLHGEFGNINVAADSKSVFHFQFVVGGTDTPITLGKDQKIPFSFYDLDETSNPHRHEFIQFVTPVLSYSVEKGTTVKVTGNAVDGTLHAQSGRQGTGQDNPTDPLRMTELQLNSKISVTYVGVSGWTVMFGNDIKSGSRNMLFAGRSEGDCACVGVSNWHIEDNLKYNNLGGMGPRTSDPPELRYEKVLTVPWTGQELDLVVTVAEGSIYKPANTDYNGLWPTEDPGHQQMAQLNIMIGTETTFDFTFVKSGTWTPATLSNVFFSIYDFDALKDVWFGKPFPNAEYAVFPKPVTDYALTTPTEVKKLGANDGTLRFESTTHGTVDDNPTDPANLTALQKSRSVTVWGASTSSFQVTFGHWFHTDVTHDPQGNPAVRTGGRNFLFAGPGIFCPAK